MMEALHAVVGFLKWCLSIAEPDNLRKIATFGGSIVFGYSILAGIVFAETGLLIGFFLPGDSLLFAAGFLASGGVFNLFALWIILSAAAIVGDGVNYMLGRRMGDYVYERGRLWLVKQEHLLQAKAFYEKHGAKAIVLCRFVPIIRTFVPFVAGVGRMSYPKFAFYNVAGGIGWVISMSLLGYSLGNVPIVQKHFEKVIILIIVISVLPVFFEIIRHRRASAKAAAESPAPAAS
jgi:membrane-associated protein